MIQPENKASILPLPKQPLNQDDLLRWARDLNLFLDGVNRQLVDKLNLHLDQTHGHPKSWANMRIPRPRYYCSASGGTTVTVPASTSVPARFVIDGELFEIYADLTCDLSASGPGGLDTGSVAADTAYYLYGIRDSGTVYIIASASDPSTGPTGYLKWTYVGACVTEMSSATLTAFQASNGFYLCNDDISSDSHTGDLLATEMSLTMPATIRMMYGFSAHNGAGAIESYVRVSGDNSTDNTLLVRSQVLNVTNYSFGWVPISTVGSVWMTLSDAATTGTVYLCGWMEDPTEWP